MPESTIVSAERWTPKSYALNRRLGIELFDEPVDIPGFCYLAAIKGTAHGDTSLEEDDWIITRADGSIEVWSSLYPEDGPQLRHLHLSNE